VHFTYTLYLYVQYDSQNIKGIYFLDRIKTLSLEGRCRVYFEIGTIYITFMLQTVKPAKICKV